MVLEYDEKQLYTQMKYLEALFDVRRMKDKWQIKDQQLNEMFPRES
jgi:hypothetical protein